MKKNKKLSAYESWSLLLALVIVVRLYYKKGRLPPKKLLQECVIIILYGLNHLIICIILMKQNPLVEFIQKLMHEKNKAFAAAFNYTLK